MATRSERYESKTDADGIEALSKRLTGDLRKHIRALGAHGVLSEKWKTMADSLNRIANISEMERKLPKEKEEATLWECEELALRYLLEDGKLNLCLRLLEQYQEYVDSHPDALKGDDETSELLIKFEKGIGVLLQNAWRHVEALQTTDLPLLVGHIGGILAKANMAKLEDKLDGLQFVKVFHYLFVIGKYLEEIDESRIMPIVLEKSCIANAIKHLHMHHELMPKEEIVVATEALALLFDSEEFKTHTEAFLESDEVKRAMVALREDFISGLTEESAMRRKLRPLTDVIARTARSLAK